jgi:maleate cis-trans isomerase
VVLCARLTPGRSFTEVDPAEVYEWVRTKTPPQADAVFIGGNGLRTVGAIHALETVLRRPVLTANQVGMDGKPLTYAVELESNTLRMVIANPPFLPGHERAPC